MHNIPHSEETKRKISEAHKGKHHSKATKLKISKALRGNKNPMWGKTRNHSEETRKKISKANKGRKLSKEHIRNMSEAKRGQIGLPKEIALIRLMDILTSNKKWGWKTKLAKKWGLTVATTRQFIKRHSSAELELLKLLKLK